ncbi:MAG: hypothetical protein M3Y83_14665 [Actinomycetota bacterium]|nr:hypothetical protein [Actinomycetota bacterium]
MPETTETDTLAIPGDADAKGDKAEPKPGKGKKAEPKPGDADYDWSAHYDTDDLYVHTFPDGTVVALKSFASIYSKTWLYKVRNLDTDVDVEFAAIDRGTCETAREVLAALDDTADTDPLDDLFKAWSASGTSRGEGDPGLSPGKSSG